MSDRRKFRASQAPQLFACAGSDELARRIRDAFPPRETAPATAGRWCHAQGATVLIQRHQATFQGDKLDWPANFKPTGFHLWMVAFYVSAVIELSHVEMAFEVEAELEHAFDRFDLSGHIDCFAINAQATEAIGFDLKTGADPVMEAADNPQVFVYICLLKLAYPTLQKVTFYIVQPSNDGEEIPRITDVTIEGEALDRAVAYLETELNRVCDNPHELNSDGWKQCRYCPAALVCPALAQDIESMKLKLTPEEFARIKLQPDLDDLVRIELVGKKLTPIFDSAHDELKDRMVARGVTEHTVEGARVILGEKNGKRSIRDNAAATERLRDMPDEVFHRLYEFKPAAIEEELAVHYKLPKTSTKGASGKSKYRELLGDLTDQPVQKTLKVITA